MIDFEKEYREKMLELVPYIGKVCCENYSPTLRAKLVSIDMVADTAIMEVIENPCPPYSYRATKNVHAGQTYVAPLWRIWNAFLF